MDRCVTMRPRHMKPLGGGFGRLCLCVGLLFGVLFSLTASAAEGVAIAIVLDTSGSMREVVRDSRGGKSPKYEIGNRALRPRALPTLQIRLHFVAAKSRGSEG